MPDASQAVVHLEFDNLEPIAWYEGLQVYADSIHVHEQAMALLARHVPPTARVLDIGAGAGAFSKRMQNHGYRNLQAVELRKEAFAVSGVPVHALDLNGAWGQELAGQFDAAVAIEVIEHLENPWHFARQCAAVVRPGGFVLVSTPNIESARSRIDFLFRAKFRFFSPRDFQRVGHITSLTGNQMHWVFQRAGFDPVERIYSRHKGCFPPRSTRKAAWALVYLLTYPFMQGLKKGEESLFLFRKKPAT